MQKYSFSEALNNFEFRDKEKILKKLSQFRAGGFGKLHLVLDFDRTLTTRRNRQGQYITTWQLLQEYLSPEGKTQYTQLFEKYRPLEASGKMTSTDAIAWWEGVLKIYRSNKLLLEEVSLEAEARMPARSYVRHLFRFTVRKKVPTVIISAGLKNIIELWCQRNGIKPSIIISTKLIFNKLGFLVGWYRHSLVHALNKKEKGHKQVSKMRKNRPNIILIGDSIDDAGMVEGEDSVVRILIYAPRKDDDPERYKEALEKFDLVVKSGSFLPIVKLLKNI